MTSLNHPDGSGEPKRSGPGWESAVVVGTLGFWLCVIAGFALRGAGWPWKASWDDYWQWLSADRAGLSRGWWLLISLLLAGLAAHWLASTQTAWVEDAGWSPRSVGRGLLGAVWIAAAIWFLLLGR